MNDGTPEPLKRLPDKGGILAGMKTIRTGDQDTLKAQVLRERAHAAAEDAGKMDAAALVSVDGHGRRIDIDERALLDPVEEAYHVMVAQDHTPVGERGADEVLPAGAVDIDVALIRIHAPALIDPLLKAFEAQNAGQDQIIAVLFVVPVFARVLAVPENASRWRIGPVLLLDPMNAERRFERVLPIAIAEAGRRGVVSFDNGVVRADEERLLLDGHHEKELLRVS